MMNEHDWIQFPKKIHNIEQSNNSLKHISCSLCLEPLIECWFFPPNEIECIKILTYFSMKYKNANRIDLFLIFPYLSCKTKEKYNWMIRKNQWWTTEINFKKHKHRTNPIETHNLVYFFLFIEILFIITWYKILVTFFFWCTS